MQQDLPYDCKSELQRCHRHTLTVTCLIKGIFFNTLYKNMSFARAGLDGDGMTGLVMTGMAPGMAGGFMPGIFYARGNYDGGSGDAGVSEK